MGDRSYHTLTPSASGTLVAWHALQGVPVPVDENVKLLGIPGRRSRRLRLRSKSSNVKRIVHMLEWYGNGDLLSKSLMMQVAVETDRNFADRVDLMHGCIGVCQPQRIAWRHVKPRYKLETTILTAYVACLYSTECLYTVHSKCPKPTQPNPTHQLTNRIIQTS